jgi:subtilisin family serine protease
METTNSKFIYSSPKPKKMKKKILMLLVTVLTAGILLAQEETPPQVNPNSKPIPDQYIVILKESAAKPVVKQQKKNNNREQKEKDNKPARDQNLKKIKDVQDKKKIKESSVLATFADLVVGFSAKLSKEEVDALKSDSDVEGVYQDYEIFVTLEKSEMTITDTYMAQQTSCAVTAAGGPADGSKKSTWIWILDTGIQTSHPDLNVVTNSTYAKSFISGQSIQDGHGHGTHVAGIAAAKNNDIGVVGVSAGAPVVPVKVLSNSGSASLTSITDGLNHVAKYDMPGDVVNMSLGGYPIYIFCDIINPFLYSAVKNLGESGTFVCIAAGNDGDCNGATKTNPGCINGTRIYTVGSITCSNTCSGFSNWGTSVVDWAAVGSSVLSTCINSTYCSKSGTSMATPVVAGIIHARGSAPVSGGTITCCNGSYKKARRL